MTRYIRVLPLCLLLACCVLLPSCAWDSNFTILGYTTKPNYDTTIRTVRLPIFKNKSAMTVTPGVGMEMDLTRAVIREIESKTPFKVVQDCAAADTELRGTIIGFQKTLLNYTGFNGVRDAETTLTVQIIWRDLRTGKVLSRPARRYGERDEIQPKLPLLATPDSLFPPGTKTPPMPGVPNGARVVVPDEEDNPIDPYTQRPIVPVTVQSTSHFVPELGPSLTTALQQNYDRLAVQIVSLMEMPW